MNWTPDEELLALGYFAETRRDWAAVGLILPDDLADAQLVPVFPELGCVGMSVGMSPMDVWQECLEEARGVLAHVCDARFCVPYPCPMEPGRSSIWHSGSSPGCY